MVSFHEKNVPRYLNTVLKVHIKRISIQVLPYRHGRFVSSVFIPYFVFLDPFGIFCPIPAVQPACRIIVPGFGKFPFCNKVGGRFKGNPGALITTIVVLEVPVTVVTLIVIK